MSVTPASLLRNLRAVVRLVIAIIALSAGHPLTKTTAFAAVIRNLRLPAVFFRHLLALITLVVALVIGDVGSPALTKPAALNIQSSLELSTKIRESFQNIGRRPYQDVFLIESAHYRIHTYLTIC